MTDRTEERFRTNPHTQPIENPHCQQLAPNHWRHWYRHNAQPGDLCLCGDGGPLRPKEMWTT
jgi:hypothetical protein